MEELIALWPSLTEAQRQALLEVARQFGNKPSKLPAKRDLLTVTQAHEQYGKPKSTIYDAIKAKRLNGSMPFGLEKGYLIERKEFERWLGFSSEH